VTLITVHVSTDDLAVAEHACRNMVDRYRIEAAEPSNPLLRAAKLGAAADFERLADRLHRLRDAGLQRPARVLRARPH
jgi:hypothetical protein